MQNSKPIVRQTSLSPVGQTDFCKEEGGMPGVEEKLQRLGKGISKMHSIHV